MTKRLNINNMNSWPGREPERSGTPNIEVNAGSENRRLGPLNRDVLMRLAAVADFAIARAALAPAPQELPEEYQDEGEETYANPDNN